MSLLGLEGIGTAITGIEDIIKRFVPDPGQAAALKAQLDTAYLNLMDNQAKTNQAEATNGSLFVAGWRPFIGWICGLGLLYSIVQPIAHAPVLDTSNILELLLCMLGVGTMRTIEKVQGVATQSIVPAKVATAVKKVLKR